MTRALLVTLGLVACVAIGIGTYLGIQRDAGTAPDRSRPPLAEGILFTRWHLFRTHLNTQIWVVDPQTGTTLRLLKSHVAISADVSPDGQRVAYAQLNSADGIHLSEGLFVQDLQSGRVRRLDPDKRPSEWAYRQRSDPRWSPD